MGMHVEITVTLNENRAGGTTDTHTFRTQNDNSTTLANWFAPAVLEQLIVEIGGPLVEDVAKVYGDIRREQPDAAGLTTELARRPLTGPEEVGHVRH